MEDSTIRLTNLIPNGGFETNATDWSGYYTTNQGAQTALAIATQTPIAPGHGETGTSSAQLGTKTQGVVYMNLTTPIPVTIGNKYYMRARIHLRGTSAASSASGATVVNSMAVPQRGTVLPSAMSDGLQTTNTTGWVLIDTIWTADESLLNFRVIWQTTANQGNNDLYGQLDNVVVVDLTDAFTSGLEPPIFAIRDGVNHATHPNGHWDGETDITMPVPPVILMDTLPLALRGRSYVALIELEEETGTPPFSFSISGLPLGHGLSIDGDGNVTGIPNLDEGTYYFDVQLTDSIGYRVTQQFEINVGEPPVILDEFLMTPTYNEAYSFIPNVIGSEPLVVFITVTEGSLPTGLSIVGGEILGTPTVDGQPCQITITAFNAYDPLGVSKVFSLKVSSVVQINTTSPLPNATLNQSYDLTFSVSGVAPITFEHLSGDLPPGLTLDGTGYLSGTPLEVGVYSFAIKATDEFSSDTQLFMLTVYEKPVITTTLLGYARLGVPYSGQLTASGSEPITYSIVSGQLPLGLSLNGQTGIISDVALAAGTYTFTVVASNIVGNSEPKTFVIEAGLALAITTTSPLRNGTLNVAYGNLQLVADGLDYSQVPVQTWSWVAGVGSSLPPGLVLNATTGILSGTPLAAGQYQVIITVVNGPMTATSPFTIEIGTPPVITTHPILTGGVNRPFTVVLQASGLQPITYQMLAPPTPEANIQLNSNGSLYWLIPVIGTYYFDIVATNVFGDSAPVPFSLTITTPAIIDVDLEDGIVGENYLHTFTGSGTPSLTWSLIGNLPNGLHFDADAATISGIPTITGTTTFDVKIANAGGSAQETFSITIHARPRLTTSDLNSGNVGAHYTQTLQASGTTPITYQLTSGTLPSGLTLVGATISGTPGTESEDVYPFTIRAQNLLGLDFADTQNLQITILPSGAPTITTSASLTGIRGVPYTLNLSANGDLPITWHLLDALPDGLTFSGSTISGTPVVAGLYSFTMTATNNIDTDTRMFTITLADPPTITTIALANGQIHTPYLDTLTADGDTPQTWSTLTPLGSETGLPPGLTLNPSTGELFGQPSENGTYTFRIRVINSSGSDTKPYSIIITNSGGTFVNGKEIDQLFINGKEVAEAYVDGFLIYQLNAHS